MRYRLSPLAYRDVIELWAYVAAETSEGRAVRVVDALEMLASYSRALRDSRLPLALSDLAVAGRGEAAAPAQNVYSMPRTVVSPGFSPASFNEPRRSSRTSPAPKTAVLAPTASSHRFRVPTRGFSE